MPLRRSEIQWLRTLCLPGCDKEQLATLPAISPSSLSKILDAAEMHSVLPAVLRQTKTALNLQPDYLKALANSSSTAEVLAHFALIDDAINRRNLVLRYWSKKLLEEFEKQDIATSVVKGQGFSKSFYQHDSDRSFSDVDFLVAKSDVFAANRVLKELGFNSAQFHDRPGHLFLEYKWGLLSDPFVNIELHVDLIHSPKLRSGQSYTYERHEKLSRQSKDSSFVHLIVACLHAAYSHQFDRMQHLVDICLAVRALDLEHGSTSIHEILKQEDNVALEAVLHSGVQLAGEMFKCSKCSRFLDTVQPRPLSSSWVKPNHVL